GQLHIQVISASFDRPVLYILDDPNMVRTTSPSKPNMTVEENLAFWKDVLESGRRYIQVDDAHPDGVCAPVKADFYVPKDDRGVNGVPLSLLARYRVVVWYAPKFVVTDAVRSALHDGVTHYKSANNTLFTYLQYGGNLWAFGGG